MTVRGRIQVIPGATARPDSGSHYLTIEAAVGQNWAAHRHLDVHGLWVLTCLPIGLNLPPDWCSFPTEEQAIAAMNEIERLSNSWHVVTPQHFSDPEMGRKLREIAKRNSAVAGPLGAIGMMDHNMMGKRLPHRPNAYGETCS